MSKIITNGFYCLVSKVDADISTIFNNSNVKVIFDVNNTLLSWVPGRGINNFDTLVKGKGYYVVAKAEIDLSGLFAEASDFVGSLPLNKLAISNSSPNAMTLYSAGSNTEISTIAAHSFAIVDKNFFADPDDTGFYLKPTIISKFVSTYFKGTGQAQKVNTEAFTLADKIYEISLSDLEANNLFLDINWLFPTWMVYNKSAHPINIQFTNGSLIKTINTGEVARLTKTDIPTDAPFSAGLAITAAGTYTFEIIRIKDNPFVGTDSNTYSSLGIKLALGFATMEEDALLIWS